MLHPLALLLVNVLEKSRRSNLLQRTSQKLVYSVARRELQSLSCFPQEKLCSFFSFNDKKCSKPNQACDFEHIGKWDKIPAADQRKILKHCHAAQGKKIWLDAETFVKHKVMVPEKFTYLLGDPNGPKSA